MNCVILEMESHANFQNSVNSYMNAGFKIIASSCNSKYYKSILIKDTESKEA